MISRIRVNVEIEVEGKTEKAEMETQTTVKPTLSSSTPQTPKPEDFINQPSTQRLRDKIEKWQRAALVSGTR
jgi:hypothetical protein